MRFTMYRPAGILAPFIDYLWCSRSAPDVPVDGSQFPEGGVTVLFCLGPRQGLVDPDTGGVEWFARSWVSGERKRPFHLRAPQGAHLIGIHFRPGGAYPFFDIPLAELADGVIALDVLWPEAEIIRDQLADQPAAEGFAVVERALMTRLAADRASDAVRAVDTVTRLERWAPGGAIRALARDLGVSQRQLLRMFAERVGLGPKGMHRVLRFQRVIRTLDTGGPPSWARLASNCGYVDQAHLIRDFKRFTGITPTRYAGLRGPDPNFAVAD